MIQWIKNWLIPTPGETPDQKWLRRAILCALGGLIIGAGAVGTCKPSFKKEVMEARKEAKEAKETLSAIREQNTRLTTLNQAYENRQRVRTTEKLAVDGTGAAVYDTLPDGSKKAVVLKTSTILASSSGSLALTDVQTQLRDSLFRETGYKSTIDSLRKELVEKRGGFDVLAIYGTGNSMGLGFLPPPVGVLRAGVLGLLPGQGGWEVLATGGLHF